jgi:hypothetical protein
MGGRYESERDLAKRLRGVDRVEIRDEVLGDTLARLEAQGRIVRDPAKPRVRRPGWLPEAASEETSQ